MFARLLRRAPSSGAATCSASGPGPSRYALLLRRAPSSGAATCAARHAFATRWCRFYGEPPRRGLRRLRLHRRYAARLPASTESPLVGGCDASGPTPHHATEPSFYGEPPRRGLRRDDPPALLRGRCSRFYGEPPRRGLRRCGFGVHQFRVLSASTESPLVGGCDSSSPCDGMMTVPLLLRRAPSSGAATRTRYWLVRRALVCFYGEPPRRGLRQDESQPAGSYAL